MYFGDMLSALTTIHSECEQNNFSTCAPLENSFLVGIPTPDPALLIEMAPPDNGSPTNLKMKFPTRAPLSADTPKDLAKWNYPPGQPTPNPALLTDVSEKVEWGYPPGVPTPGKQCTRDYMMR